MKLFTHSVCGHLLVLKKKKTKRDTLLFRHMLHLRNSSNNCFLGYIKGRKNLHVANLGLAYLYNLLFKFYLPTRILGKYYYTFICITERTYQKKKNLYYLLIKLFLSTKISGKSYYTLL